MDVQKKDVRRISFGEMRSVQLSCGDEGLKLLAVDTIMSLDELDTIREVAREMLQEDDLLRGGDGKKYART